MHGMVFQPINMKNEQNITGSNTLTEDTPAPADNTPGGTKPAKKMTRRVLIGGGIGTLAVAGVGAGWAYNRYLAEHTQIEDTLAYEAAQQSKNNPSGAADPTELTGVSITGHPLASRSDEYINDFSQEIDGAVVGRSVEDAHVTALAGASKTSAAYNDAVDAIAVEARTAAATAESTPQ